MGAKLSHSGSHGQQSPTLLRMGVFYDGSIRLKPEIGSGDGMAVSGRKSVLMQNFWKIIEAPETVNQNLRIFLEFREERKGRDG